MNGQQIEHSEQQRPVERQAMESLSISQVAGQIELIQNLMKSVMKDGEHFGTIPGCGKKPALLKAGAEKIGFTFRLRPEFDIQATELGHGHREYRITCRLIQINTGVSWGEGVGSCSTMEAKYRYRVGQVESTGKSVPKEYWSLRASDPDAALELIGGKGFSTKKIDDKWEIVQKGERIENPDPADQYNTVLKMAKKRAHVDAILTATAASDFFTQDIDETVDEVKSVNGNGNGAKPKPPKEDIKKVKADADRKPTAIEIDMLLEKVEKVMTGKEFNELIYTISKGTCSHIENVKTMAGYRAIESAIDSMLPDQAPKNKELPLE